MQSGVHSHRENTHHCLRSGNSHLLQPGDDRLSLLHQEECAAVLLAGGACRSTPGSEPCTAGQVDNVWCSPSLSLSRDHTTDPFYRRSPFWGNGWPRTVSLLLCFHQRPEGPSNAPVLNRAVTNKVWSGLCWDSIHPPQCPA